MFRVVLPNRKNVSFRSFAYFKLNFVPTLRISNLLFEFRTFYLSFVPFILILVVYLFSSFIPS